MALSGTLKDFGIADILQLIGHQTKTGALILKSGNDEVEVMFVDGNVVFATQKARDRSDLLGSLLLRAELITEDKLQEALEEQQRSLKRLGDVLVQQGLVEREKLAQVMRLQTTETLYKLFRWKTGTYEFSQQDVDAAKSGFEPIRAESILLEGFRRMDEWPAVRKKIPWGDATFQKLRSVDDPPESNSADAVVTDSHRRVYGLALEGRTADKVSDVSLLGEFEAIKALVELQEWGYLKVIPPAGGRMAAFKGLTEGGRRWARSGALLRLVMSGAFFCATIFLVHLLAPALGSSRSEKPARHGAVARLLSHDQLLRLESALELYRLEHGEYPRELQQLVEGRVVAEEDLRYPFREPYHYRRTQRGFVLLPPLD
ncbi:MAG TPA: DUF4388 domain-containing protein [Myxococcales bacterium]|jgi:hypothetical protein|nr:DUF4388 domain-containing protein [Myxococcales bacterium]